MTYRISVDTGGTFTDVVVNDSAGNLTIGKALTTHGRIFSGMQMAIENAATSLGLSLNELLTSTKIIIYGTTRSTNAIVTKRVAKTAFLTTQGFPDTLVLKEGGKFNPHDFSQEYPDPYIPRRYTFEIPERVDCEGNVVTPLDEQSARLILSGLKAQGFEAIAVCLIWSTSNSKHEQRLGELIEEILPDTPYTLSHRLIPIVREYRRASATAIDASLKPLMQDHLKGLQSDLRDAGFEGDLLVSTAAGGCSRIEDLIEKPIYTIGSGPSMAPIAGITFSQLEDMGDNVIICDTGGTTFDVGVVRDGRLTFSRETWIGPAYTGDLLGISAVDMRSIGAGGGSIAWIDDGGLLRVGPQSAGSEPGPACYGRGGLQPTVSDAAVTLGYFDPDYFLGGRMILDRDAASTSIRTISDKIGQTPEETAYQILMLASDLMVRAIGDVTIAQGFDPRESTIVAGGGAAGLNIMAIAKELGSSRVVLPKVASALSASGMQYANIVAEEAATCVTNSRNFDAVGVNKTLEALEERLLAFRQTLSSDLIDYTVEFAAEARYASQVWDLDTPLAKSRLETADDLAEFVESFHETHERMFAVRDEQSAVEIVNWKARLIVNLASSAARPSETEGRVELKSGATRACYFGTKEWVDTPVFKPSHIKLGGVIAGPAIIEEPTTTLVVFPEMSAEISGSGNYILHIKAA